jgi:cell division protein ZapA
MARPPATGDRMMTLDVSLLGRDYKVACKESERAELTATVAFLDQRMREIRDSGKIAGAERIAVMAALNMAHDYLRIRDGPRAPRAAAAAAIDDVALRRRIDDMQSAIDQALESQERIS